MAGNKAFCPSVPSGCQLIASNHKAHAVDESNCFGSGAASLPRTLRGNEKGAVNLPDVWIDYSLIIITLIRSQSRPFGDVLERVSFLPTWLDSFAFAIKSVANWFAVRTARSDPTADTNLLMLWQIILLHRGPN